MFFYVNLCLKKDKKKEICLRKNFNNKVYPKKKKKKKKPNGECTKNFEVLDSLNNEKGKGIVLCMSDEIFPIDRNNYYVPVSYI